MRPFLPPWLSWMSACALGWTCACAPTLDPATRPSMLEPVATSLAGTIGFHGEADAWLVVQARLDAEATLVCRDADCRVRAAERALRAAAEHGVQAVLVSAESGALWRDSALQAVADETGVVLVPGVRVSPGLGPQLTLAGIEPGALQGLTTTPPALDGAALRRLARETAALEGISILRHLCHQDERGRALVKDLDTLSLLTALEIDGPAFVDPSCARAHWQRLLQQGVRLVGLASSARWGVEPRPHAYMNLVRSLDRSPAGITRAIAAGHVQAVRGSRHRPRIHMGVDLDGDGRFDDARQGDQVAVASDEVVVRLRAIGARGGEVLLYTEAAEGPIARRQIDQTDQALAFRYHPPVSGSGFVRAEFYRSGELLVISNPLFLLRAPVTTGAGAGS